MRDPLTRFGVIILGFCNILEGLATVFSVGYARPDLESIYWNYLNRKARRGQ